MRVSAGGAHCQRRYLESLSAGCHVPPDTGRTFTRTSRHLQLLAATNAGSRSSAIRGDPAMRHGRLERENPGFDCGPRRRALLQVPRYALAWGNPHDPKSCRAHLGVSQCIRERWAPRHAPHVFCRECDTALRVTRGKFSGSPGPSRQWCSFLGRCKLVDRQAFRAAAPAIRSRCSHLSNHRCVSRLRQRVSSLRQLRGARQCCKNALVPALMWLSSEPDLTAFRGASRCIEA